MTKRSFVTIPGLAAAIPGALALLTKKPDTLAQILVVIVLLSAGAGTYFCFQLIKPREHYDDGTEPVVFFNKEQMQIKNFSPENLHRNTMHNLLLHYQERINGMKALNKKRLPSYKNMNIAFVAVAMSVLALAIKVSLS